MSAVFERISAPLIGGGTVPLWFPVLLLLNALVVLVYFLISRLRGGEGGSLRLRCLVMLLCPVAGPVFFGCSWLYYRLFFRAPVDLDDVIFNKDKSKMYMKADEERERDFVPLEEAIAVTDKASTRTLMLEVVRRDISSSLASISLALNSEDSEVSHYAASVLQETLNGLRVDFQKLYRQIGELEQEISAAEDPDAPLRTAAAAQPEAPAGTGEAPKRETSDSVTAAERENEEAAAVYREEERRKRNKEEAYRQGLLARDGTPDPNAQGLPAKLAEEMAAAHDLLDGLYKVLHQEVFSPGEQRTYTDMMEETARLIDRRDLLTAYELEEVIAMLLRLSRYDRCLVWCRRSAELYPKALSSYTAQLKVYFAMDDRPAFFRVMNALKASDVPLDHETLEMVRVFL